MKRSHILVADDDDAICTVVEQALLRQGYSVRTTANVQEMKEWVEAGDGDLVITDVVMPSGNGLELLESIKTIRPDLPVIVMSAQNTLRTAVKANELGAFEFLPKPFDLHEMVDFVRTSLNKRGAAHKDVAADLALDDVALVGNSPAMQEIYRIMARLVNNDLTVMIEGESGTGKELVARAIHSLGKRKAGPFVAINMAAIPKDLVESELFGHEKGAFTGALSRKTGKFEQAAGGTLFLDEIGDMPAEAQTKLLRVLQQGEFTPVGGNRMQKTNVRILCATHRDLKQLIKNGEFREDLYYRLHVVPVRVPALRERAEDIALLADHFLQKASEKGLPRKMLDKQACAALQQFIWPGNVRQLENVMYRIAALHSEANISASTIANELRAVAQEETNSTSNTTPHVSTKETLQEHVSVHLQQFFDAHRHTMPAPGLYDRIIKIVEKPLIEHTLRVTGGNQLKAARILGINRNTLRKKMSELDMLQSPPRKSAGGM